MDPASFCVYNVTRNALLSERVVSVSEPQTPSELLALVMNGPGRDPHYCIRITNVSVTPDIHRLFAFDVAYLDSEQRIVQCGDVGPGTPFPAITAQVATVLFLSHQLLARSNSEEGDFIRICTEAELAALLRATAQFQALQPPPSRYESEGPQIASEPFDGSLIFLPASGTPQTREIFLFPNAPRSLPVDLPIEEPAEALSGPTSPEAQLVESLVDSIQPPPQSEPLQSGEVHLSDTPPASRFFEAGPHQPPLPLTQSHETQQTLPSPPSQLPFSLKAVIQLVDEQLRREQQQQQSTQPQRVPEKSSEPEDAPPNSFATIAIPGSEIASPGIVAPEIAPKIAPEIREQPPVSRQIEITPENVPPPSATSPAPYQAPVLFKPARALRPAPKTTKQDVSSLPEVESPSTAELQPAPAEPSQEAPRPIPLAKEKLPFATRVQRWLAGESISLSGNRRRGERVELPGLVAFYFTGGAPKPHEIVNISSSGLYLRSKDLWSPNTLVRMTLERQDAALAETRSISVLARVVRIDEEGIGHEFVTTEVLKNLRAQDFLPQQGTNRKELEKFLAGPK